MVKIVIVGGGFAGLNAAQALKKSDVEILLIDRTNHHVFQPLLYQVATAALSAENIASPIREILRKQKNVTVLMANVDKIDLQARFIEVGKGEKIPYDYLILAPGARHSYFGHDNWEAYAPGLKTIADAVRIHDQILLAFEKAEACGDPTQAENEMRFVVIGGGPTGVEMAGSIAEFAHITLKNNFRHIRPEKAKIFLIEGTNRLLPAFSQDLADKANENLKNLGVDVFLTTLVTSIEPHGIWIGDQFLAASTIIWAAGNQASSLLKTIDIPLDKQGRALVEPDLSIPGHPNVFVIGDAACSFSAKGIPLPGIAPVAIQQGRYVAKLLQKPGEKRQPFAYFDKGMIATIGRGKAVAMVGKVKFSGFIAWIAWCFIHIFYLVSFRHRIFVMIQWIFLYFTSRRQGRVINKGIK
ncbi:MAG: NAD(P)/FAD-dependent oxidoreductase [Candidatus Protochlamydia sp.]|nr:NAD(P)/FAD-dependent oxidoreductase [Candidatus Protochlamydia sp.]